jgi:hypothetical protein
MNPKAVAEAEPVSQYFDNFEGVKRRELEPKFVGEKRSSGPTALGIWIEHGTLDYD